MRARKLEDQADFVIVGTGAGGATAARVLSAAGHSVIMLEEGPHLRAEERVQPVEGAMAQSMRDLATLTTRGKAPFPLLQGRCVGGSTAVNSGIIWRMPPDVREVWIREHGLEGLVGGHALSEAFDTIETDLGVAEVPEEVMGGNASLMRDASRTLGLPGHKALRNAPGCRGAARCLQGCPNAARQSMDVSYVPAALRDGARLHAHARATKIRIEAGRATAVQGDMLDPDTRQRTGRFEVHARRAVVVAASAVQTPILLRRSGLRGLVGERFQAHPGAAMVARFPDPVNMGFGATQSYEVDLRPHGYKLESLSLPPELLAARLPGAGAEWQRALVDMDHYAQWCAVVRMEALGRVRPSRVAGAEVRYAPTRRDMQRLRDGLALIAKMMFAAGAEEVYPGIAGIPEVLREPSEADALAHIDLRPRRAHLIASHLFGTACAGADPARSVVGPDLQTHRVKDLYVMDGSVFPTNLGVNPQHSIMGVAHVAAQRLANHERLPRAA